MDSCEGMVSSKSNTLGGYETACKRLNSVARICESIAWSQRPNVLYQTIVDSLARELDCNNISLYLLTTTGDHLTEHAYHRGENGKIVSFGKMPITVGRLQFLIREKLPIISDYRNLHRDDDKISTEKALAQGFLGSTTIPLLAGDEVQGIFSLSYKEEKSWTDLDIDYLMSIGRVLGIMIHNTKLAKNKVELQTLIERKRLGSEIHDNLSQLISLIKIQAETAQISVEEDNKELVSQDIAKIVETSHEALKVLREEILYLHASLNETDDLVVDIEDCITRFTERWNLAVKLQVIGIDQPVTVSKEVILQLTRVLHEALSNALRHAFASEVLVTLFEEGNRLILQIADDGRGFSPRLVPEERMGLRIMKERVDSLGGTLLVDSQEGCGAIIRATIPR